MPASLTYMTCLASLNIWVHASCDTQCQDSDFIITLVPSKRCLKLMHSLYLIESLCSENYTFGIILSCSSRYTFLIQLKSAPPRHWFLCLFWLLKWVLSGNRTLSSVVVVQSLSCIWLCNPTDIAHQASLSFTVSWSLLKLMSVESVMPFTCLILCRPLLLLPSILPSIRVFLNELALHIRWPKYWSFSFSIKFPSVTSNIR